MFELKKKVLVYAHYFYPDVASTGQILTELCEGLQDDFNITVICVVPSYGGVIEQKYKHKRIYNEKHQNINIVRVRVPDFQKNNKISRIKNILVYFFNAIIATFKVEKQDIVFSISQPPILGGILGVIGKIIKRAKFIYNIQDFNPEQTEAVGYSKNKLLLKFAKALDKHSCKKSDTVVVVGRDMQQTLEKRFKNKKVPKNIVINNWINEAQIYPLECNHPKVMEFKNKYDLVNKFVFMYSGNLGLYYDLENLIKVFEKFKDEEDAVFVFIGDGTLKNKLVGYAEDNDLKNIRFIPYQKKEHLIYSLNAADVHIVTNAKGIKGISVPSKIYGVMAVGKPVLGILEKNSEARILIEECNCGMCCEPENYNQIKTNITKFFESKHIINEYGARGRKMLMDNYTKKKSIDKYKNLLIDVLQGGSKN